MCSFFSLITKNENLYIYIQPIHIAIQLSYFSAIKKKLHDFKNELNLKLF